MSHQRRDGRIALTDSDLVKVWEVIRRRNTVRIDAGIERLAAPVAVEKDARIVRSVKELRVVHPLHVAPRAGSLAVGHRHGVRAARRRARKGQLARRKIARIGHVSALYRDDLVRLFFRQVKILCLAVRAVPYLSLARQAVQILQQRAAACRCDRRHDRWDVSLHSGKALIRAPVPAHVFVSIEQVYLAAEAEKVRRVLCALPDDRRRRKIRGNIKDQAAERAQQMPCGPRNALPRAAKGRGSGWGGVGCHPGLPCRLERQNGLCPGPHLQMPVARDLKIAHLGELSVADLGVAVRVLVQSEKCIDLHNACAASCVDPSHVILRMPYSPRSFRRRSCSRRNRPRRPPAPRAPPASAPPACG